MRFRLECLECGWLSGVFDMTGWKEQETRVSPAHDEFDRHIEDVHQDSGATAIWSHVGLDK